MSRLHPFDFAFGPVAARWFPDIQRDAETAGRDPDDRGAFGTLGTVQDHLTAMVGEAGAGASEGYVQLLYAAFRFWQAGKHTVPVRRAALEPRLASDPAPDRPVPHGACYVQLPEHWFWSRVEESSPHEPLDGMFVLSALHGREVLVVGILGLRPDRPGLSQITASATPGDVAAAAAAAAHPRFTPAISGGAARGLQSVNSVAELLLLASLALALPPG